MAELADALDLGSSAQKACRFKSCSRHHLLIPTINSVWLSALRSALIAGVPRFWCSVLEVCYFDILCPLIAQLSHLAKVCIIIDVV